MEGVKVSLESCRVGVASDRHNFLVWLAPFDQHAIRTGPLLEVERRNEVMFARGGHAPYVSSMWHIGTGAHNRVDGVVA